MPDLAPGAEAPIHDFLRQRLRDAFRGNISRFSEACDSTPSMASKWISDDPRRRVTPSPASCQKIAHGLRLDPDYVLALAGHRNAALEPVSNMDPRLAAFLAELETGWRAMDDAARDMAERTARALFHVPPVQRRRRVTDDPEDLGRHMMDIGQQKPLARKKYQPQSLAAQRIAFGFQPAY
jgi:hypothetical protein